MYVRVCAMLTFMHVYVCACVRQAPQMAVEGDLVLQEASWVSYGPQAIMMDRNIVWVPTQGIDSKWMMSARDLRTALERAPPTENRRVMVMNYPSNPTGMTYTAEELEAIAEVCREHRLIVVADEIYGYLTHGLDGDGAAASLAQYYPEGTVISNGLSKWAGAGGYRIGE
jgi:aspartate aminotransferase